MKGYCCGAVSNYVAVLWEVVIPVLKVSYMGKDQVSIKVRDGTGVVRLDLSLHWTAENYPTLLDRPVSNKYLDPSSAHM